MNDTPRFAGTMGILRWIIFGAMAVFAVIMALLYFGVIGGSASDAGAAQYHCPMHPTYISSQPGDCPICGMSLVPVPKDHEATSTGATTGDHESAGSLKEADAGHHASTPDVPGLVPVTLEPRRIQMIGLRTGPVERRVLDDDTRAAGYITVDETRTSSITVRASGWVRKLFVNQTGVRVSKGEPLLTLYSQDLYSAQQDLLIAIAARERTTGDEALQRTRESLLDASRDRLRLLGMSDEDLARLEESREAASELTIHSRSSGVVLDKTVIEGQFVTPDQALFQIADLGTVWALADVYEQDIARVAIGSPARMTVTAFPGEVFEGKVTFLYPSVSEVTRTLKVRLEFANPSTRLRPGMYAEIEFAGGGFEVTAVPVEAVMDGGETRYVFVVHNGTHFEPRLIQIGRRSDEWVEIQSGVDVGDTVVTSANFLIDSESRLKAAIAGMGGSTNANGKSAGEPGGGHTH